MPTALSIRRRTGLLLAAVATLCLVSGCHKQQRVIAAAIVPPPPPVEMIQVPPVTHITPDATFDGEEPQPPAQEEEKPTPKPHRPAPAKPSAPAQSSSAPVSIGEFTTGGDLSPQQRADTAALLNDCHNRLARLSTQAQSNHRDLVERIRNFIRQADDAWKSGDVEGTRNLATKARVLLDEVQR